MADILVVEDDEDLAWTMEQLLLVDGHVVRVALDGEEAMRLLADRIPDLVVTDLEMPVLGGEGLAYRMFIEDAGKDNIPIIIISGFPDLEDVAKRIDTPYFIAKPYVIDDVLALISRALQERTLPKKSSTVRSA